MFEILKDTQGQVVYKKIPTINIKPSDAIPLKPSKYVHTLPGTYNYNKWIEMHNDIIMSLMNAFIKNVQEINAGAYIVHVNHGKLRDMLSKKMYDTSYNKEKRYADLIN